MASTIEVSPDFVTIVTNIGVFITAAATVGMAIWSAGKKIREEHPEGPQKVVGGMIMDNASLHLWRESNHTVSERLDDLRDEMREHRFALRELCIVMTQLRDKL